MAISMRLEFQITDGPSGEIPTVGDVKRWVEAAYAHGASDDDHILRMYDEREDLEGFFAYVGPSQE